jgi:hypothetical protein
MTGKHYHHPETISHFGPQQMNTNADIIRESIKYSVNLIYTHQKQSCTESTAICFIQMSQQMDKIIIKELAIHFQFLNINSDLKFH